MRILVMVVLIGCKPASTSSSTTPVTSGGGGSPTDPWHAEVEAEARGLPSHKDVVRACGHPVEVKFDWATYRKDDFKPGAAGPRSPAMCAPDMLQGLWIRCDDKAAKEKTARIQSLTCHYKPCKDVRTTVDVASGSTPSDEGLAEFKYEIEGTTIHVYHCASSSVFTQNSARQWLEKNL